MEKNVAYMIPEAPRQTAWKHVKQVLRPNSVHVAAFTATGDRYVDKKTIFNVASRLRVRRSSFFIVCDLFNLSDTISSVQEVCNSDSALKYNVVAEYCGSDRRLRAVIELGPGLLDHKSHNVVTYRNSQEMEAGHQGRILDSSARQEVALLIGDDSFESLVPILKQQCRYVVTFCSDSTQVQALCRRVGVTPRLRNEEDRWVLKS